MFTKPACDASSQFKMPPHVFSLEPDAEITSRRCYVACTGFRSGGRLTSSWRALFTCHWLDKLLITSPRIFTSLLQVQIASSVPLRTGRAVSHAHQHVRRQKLCRSRDSYVEQSAIESTRRKTQFSKLQAPVENSLVYCWPQRNVNNYLLRYRNTLTYLLTYIPPWVGAISTGNGFNHPCQEMASSAHNRPC